MLSTKFINIKVWLHCLTSESNGGFLVNEINVWVINVWVSMMSGHGTNLFFLIKKKDWMSRTLAKPPLPQVQ